MVYLVNFSRRAVCASAVPYFPLVGRTEVENLAATVGGDVKPSEPRDD